MWDWIASNGQTIAAIASAIAASLSVWATFRGPVVAAEVAERMKNESAKQENIMQMRRVIFFTLMQQRATLASEQAVQSFNAIDVVFHDCGSVREAWADLYHYFASGSLTSQATEDKTRELLRQMAISLGIGDVVRRDDLSRVYYPNAMHDENYIKSLQRIAAKQALEGQLRPAMANTAPPDTAG